MLIDTDKTDHDEALSAVITLLPQLGRNALHVLLKRTIPAVIRRKAIDRVSKAGFDVQAGLLAAADVKATREAAQVGIAEIDDTPGAIVPDLVAYDDERDEDGDEVLEPTPLVEVQPIRVNEIDAE